MCSEVYEDGSALETAMELAKHYAELAPRAIFKTKHLMRDSFNKSYEQNLKDEAKLQEDMVGRKDNIEGVMAFVEKENQISRANNYIIENFSEHHLDDVMEIEIHAIRRLVETYFEKILEQRSLSFVVIENSQIVGFCIANKVLDECHLQNISVIDTMRRQGVGNFMLDILKKEDELVRYYDHFA